MSPRTRPTLRRATVGALVALLALAPALVGAQAIVERPDWRAPFDSAGVTGTFAIRRVGSDTTTVHDVARARTPFIPASTFKIPNSIIALELGIVRDETQRFPFTWPRQEIEAWNRDHTFASALAASVVPIYQQVAREVGTERYREWLARLDYGNRDPGGLVDYFWLDGDLRISVLEQLDFLERLATMRLPVSERSQRIVHGMMVQEWSDDCVVARAKTGLSGVAARADVSNVGWYVGWVETGGERWVFALNLDSSKPGASAKRVPLARAMLERAGAGCARS
ncbi:MAG TPA: penicillin-binding transpeptidase domain-containing protein [Gemmatimonadaceae bacterium]|nr:penicillin-binding transpeptidase domain-containing protein [Gemmatimonadaceae bacterium]